MYGTGSYDMHGSSDGRWGYVVAGLVVVGLLAAAYFFMARGKATGAAAKPAKRAGKGAKPVDAKAKPAKAEPADAEPADAEPADAERQQGFAAPMPSVSATSLIAAEF